MRLQGLIAAFTDVLTLAISRSFRLCYLDAWSGPGMTLMGMFVPQHEPHCQIEGWIDVSLTGMRYRMGLIIHVAEPCST